MKYQQKLEQIQSGHYTRTELQKLKANAINLCTQGDVDAKVVVDAIDNAVPSDTYMVFMGFCPNAELANRSDVEWRKEGVCDFDFKDSPKQMEDFMSIHVNDLIILKKRDIIGKTMKLYGWGRVHGVRPNTPNGHQLVMEWSAREEVIEVPLMACNSTVNLRGLEEVEKNMPDRFFHWLGGNWVR